MSCLHIGLKVWIFIDETLYRQTVGLDNSVHVLFPVSIGAQVIDYFSSEDIYSFLLLLIDEYMILLFNMQCRRRWF